MDQQLKIRLDAIDNTLKSFKDLQKNLKTTKVETDKTVQSFINLKTVLYTAVAIVLGRVAQQVVRLTSEYQDLRTSLNLVTGSVEKGAEALSYLSNLSKNTTLSTKDLADAFSILSTSGVKRTDELFNTLIDTFSATGKRVEVLNSLVTLFAKGTQGGLGLQAIQNLIKQGIPVWDILEKQIGITKDTFSTFAETYSGSRQILTALQKGLEESFSGATVQRANDLSVSLSRIGKEYDKSLKQIGEQGLSDAFKELSDAFANLNEQGKPFLEFLGDLGAFVVRSGASILNFFTSLSKKLSEVRKESVQIEDINLQDFLSSQYGVNNQPSLKVPVETKNESLTETLDIYDEIFDGIENEVKQTEKLIDYQEVMNKIFQQNDVAIRNFNNQFGSTEDIAKSVTSILNKGIEGFSQNLAEAVVLGKSLTDTFRSLAQSVLVAILKQTIELIARETLAYFWKQLQTTELWKQLILEKAITKEKEAQARAKGSSGGGGDFISTAFNVARSIFGFAEGGSVKAGEPITVGERGREVFMPKTDGTIIPHEKLGGATNINFSITATDVRGVKELLIDNRATITNIVNQALNSRGKPALV